MPERPYTILSCSVSLDGYLGGATEERLVLSNDADLDRVDRVRSECDAILVGAGTVRDDNPRLLVRDAARRRHRVARGLPESPTKVTLTRHGRLDAASNFFTAGSSEKIVYCPTRSLDSARSRLAQVATLVDGGRTVEVGPLCEDLHDRGVRRLMVEGGGRVHTQFLTAGAADELHLVVAPFFVGTSQARRFVGDGAFPWNAGHRAQLVETQQIGDVVLLRYALSSRFGDSL
jgi:5-amino-6-(5-phosphoribosylamino)uracil reductase